MALVTADTASEAILGLLAADGAKPLAESARWEDVLAAAANATQSQGGIPAALAAKLRSAHRLRNMAIHHGSEPAPAAAQRAIKAARELLDLSTSRSSLLRAFGSAGPVRAVAKLVGVERLSEPLREAADALGRGDAVATIDGAAIALDRALRLVDPPLRPADTPYNWSLRSMLRIRDGEVNHAIGELRKGINNAIKAEAAKTRLLESWVIALGIGLSPRELARLTRILGQPEITGADETTNRPVITVRRQDEAVLDLAGAEAALLAVADIVFRLWASDSLRTVEA
jgi:hypothetical protein